MIILLFIILLNEMVYALNQSRTGIICPPNFVKSSTQKCISITFLQKSSKPSCVHSTGWMHQGGCHGQCYNPYKYPLACQEKDVYGIGICKIFFNNLWSTCCPIGHVLSSNGECLSQLQYHNGSIIKDRLFDTPIETFYLGIWTKKDVKKIDTFINNLQKSQWMDSLTGYYMRNSKGKENYATDGFKKPSSIPLLDIFENALNLPIIETILFKYLTKKLSTKNNRSIFVLLLDEKMSMDGYCQRMCGYHSFLQHEKDLFKFIVVKNPNGATGMCHACMHPSLIPPHHNSPNGKIVDSIIYQLSYFLAETVTNPYSDGWNAPVSSTNNETIGISGMCSNRFYEPLLRMRHSRTNAPLYYNSIVGDRPYLLHEIWNRELGKCTTGSQLIHFSSSSPAT